MTQKNYKNYTHPDNLVSFEAFRLILKNALEKMGGKIRFESEKEKGAIFYVTIPGAMIEA